VTSMKKKYRTIYIVTAALMVAMVGGYALAATTVTTLNPGQSSNITTTPTPGGFANIGAIQSESLVVLTANMVGSHVSGTAIGTVGLNGTPWAMTACAAAPCAAQNFRPASATAETAGDFGEQIVMLITQPASTGTSLGFDYSITLSITVGVVTSNVLAQGFLATGLSTGAAAVTIPTFLYIDLGTTTAPVINSLSVVFNQCSSASGCP